MPGRVWIQLGALFTLLVAFDIAVFAMFADLDFWSGFLVGASVAALVGAMAWLVLEMAGARSFAIGGLGERWTAEELRRLRRFGYTVIDDVVFINCCNVDHVVIGPTGVFAVETKFTSVPWIVTNGEPNAALSAAIHAAGERARKVKLLLNHLGRPNVTPVLVMWGFGAPDLPGGIAWVGDTLVCDGARAKEWRSALASGEVVCDLDRRREFVAVIERHIAVQEGAATSP